MRVRFDHGVPVPLRHELEFVEVSTAFELGWHTLRNGDLIARAENNGFDLMMTTDKNLRYQQNIAGRRIAIVVLSTTSWPRIRNCSASLRESLKQCVPGQFLEIAIP